MREVEKQDANETKRQRIIDNNYHCEVCNKRFSESQLQLAHKISASKQNIKSFGRIVMYHKDMMSLTCSDCNSSVLINIAANPVKATELLIRIIHDILCDDPLIFETSKLNTAFDNMIKIGKCEDITNLIVLSELDIIRKFFTKWKEL